MKEFIKENILLSVIPQLQIKTTLPNPADMSDSDKVAGLCFVPSEGIYQFDETNDVWVKIIDVSSPGQSSDNVIGCIKPFYGTSAQQTQNGWILCDGRTLNYNDYPELAQIIDSTLQPGSTFTIPNLTDYYPTMIGTSAVAGMNSDVYTLGQTKLPTFPNHKHQDSADVSHNHTYGEMKHNHKYNNMPTPYMCSGSGAGVNFQGAGSSIASASSYSIFGNSIFSSTQTSTTGSTNNVYPASVKCLYYIKAE